MSRFICIFPKDVSTSFLTPVCELIKNKFNATIYNSVINNEEQQNAIFNTILEKSQKEQPIFIFLGHSTERCLHGSPLSDFNSFNFLTLDDANGYLLQFDSITISCNSNSFLRKANLSGVGFGNIPTDVYEAEMDACGNETCAWYAVKEEEVTLFRNIFVEVLQDTFNYLSEDFSSKDFYFAFCLFANRYACKLLLKKTPDSYKVATILFQVKREIELLG